jgi:putative DNA primase/helicase
MGKNCIVRSQYNTYLIYANEGGHFDEGRWKVDRTLQVMNKAKDTVKLMIKEAGKNISGATGEDQVKKAQQVYRETLKGKSERSIKSMIELAKSDMPITAGELDKDPYLLNCKNGIVDLRTGKLTKHELSPLEKEYIYKMDIR